MKNSIIVRSYSWKKDNYFTFLFVSKMADLFLKNELLGTSRNRYSRKPRWLNLGTGIYYYKNESPRKTRAG